MIAAAGKPALRVARVGGRSKPTTRAEEPPSRAYAASIEPGQPWHFSHESVRRRTQSRRHPRSKTSRIGSARRTSRSTSHAPRSWLQRSSGPAGPTKQSLIARHPSWEERQAIVEADAIVGLVNGHQDDIPRAGRPRARSTKRAVVVDARCLQDPAYSKRGVGRHRRGVLEATRRAATGHDLILLTSAELPDLDDELSELADDVIFTPYAVRAADIQLFIQLSPMTATCAATVPFLARPTCATASLVYDFIPAQFPAAYLSSPARS